MVIIGTVIAYIFYTNNEEPFKLTGKSNMILEKLYNEYFLYKSLIKYDKHCKLLSEKSKEKKYNCFIGSMGNGLPPISPPHFSISDGNRTYDFLETTAAMGTTLFSVPIVSTIEHMAIAKAFGMLYH